MIIDKRSTRNKTITEIYYETIVSNLIDINKGLDKIYNKRVEYKESKDYSLYYIMIIGLLILNIIYK